MPQLDRIHVAGFKSIRDQEISLRPLNVLIGANGSGKTNLIAVFRLLNEVVDENLQVHVARSGGANQFLYFGRQTTDKIVLRLTFGANAYACELQPTTEDGLIFANEAAYFQGQGYSRPYEYHLGSGHKEAHLGSESRAAKRKTIADHVLTAFKSWKIYHFHDTGASARVKSTGDLDDNDRLRADAGNLAAFLYRLRETDHASYRNVVDTVRMVAPFFRDFNLRLDPLAQRKIRLEWQENGSDSYFNAHALSDGTLRFICLATLLLQPQLPTTVLIDEPELGLHPYAITVLAELMRSAAAKTQLLVSTQSVTLVNQLDPEEVIVVDRDSGESIFRRLGEEEIAGWLDDYSLGELWEKNVIGGRPARSVSP
jgi:predicted ATPase